LDPSRRMLLRSEDLFAEPARIWAELLAFLELDFVPLPAGIKAANAGAGEAASVSPALRGWLRDQLEPTYQAMERIYGLRW
jgi:hypothetical protein